MLFNMHHSESFASRYFQQSGSHQSLLTRILQDAEEARLAKRIEFGRKQTEYQRLNKLYNDTICEYTTVVIDDWPDPPETEERHSGSCAHCRHRQQRDALTITVHEWPLPHHKIEIEAIVFELDVPLWLAFWRDARFYLLHVVLEGKRDIFSPSGSYRLSERDPHLSRNYFRGSRSHRIDLLSESKPFTVSHYATKKMSAVVRDSDICVANGLRYQYYDVKSSWYVGDLTWSDAVAGSCMYTLSSQQLQRYIFRPASAPDGIPPNAVIASQDSCPHDMTLEEYTYLASIPLGHHIQWASMMLQLAMPSVDFKKGDTTLVFLQCIYQNGPPNSNVVREAHSIFLDDAKVDALLIELAAATERVKQNWESAQALSLFAAMATRVLSLHPQADDRCSRLLAHIRDIALEWMGILRDRAHAATDHRDRTALVSKSVEVALICTSTFDVDELPLSTMLASPVNASILFQSCIIVQQGERTRLSDGQYPKLLYSRYYRLLHRCHVILARCGKGLDDAVTKSWSAYMPGKSGWGRVSDAVDYWLTTQTTGGQAVHYNVLDGELLVDGMPLDQPPKHYRAQPLYDTLFGSTVVEVMPASSQGFRFSTKRKFGGCAVQLGMRSVDGGNTDTLTVQTIEGNSIFETIPRVLLAEAFPDHFTDDYVHWYDYQSGNVQFRPLQGAWDSRSAKIWNLARSKNGQAWQLSKDHNTVLGLHKATSQTTSSFLRPIADAAQIHCILQGTDALLNVDIPTARLGFSLSSGCSVLSSKEFRNMAVDCTQAIGTLVGFENKLLLKSEVGERLLLVPESVVSYSKRSGHVAVSIDRNSTVKVHALHVDAQLGRLIDNGNLQCKVYLALLHALTSFCLPDPMTHRTGTEQALSILASSSVRSFDQLSQANVDMLANIARLSPGRQYYPAHKHVMQDVTWDHQLDPLAQHSGLRMRVEEIFQQAKQVEFMFPDIELDFPQFSALDGHLRDRDMIRGSTFRVSEFGAEDHCVAFDVEYNSRDRAINSQKGMNATFMSGVVYRPGHDKHWETPTADQLWQKMQDVSEIKGFEVVDKDLRYDADYMCDGLEFILSSLPALHRCLARLRYVPHNRYSIMAWLSTLVFPLRNPGCGIVQMIAMFHKSDELSRIEPPSARRFFVQEGKYCCADNLRRIMERHRYDWTQHPEFRLRRELHEYQRTYENRRRRASQAATSSAIASLVNLLEAQWPCENPITPIVPNASSYVNISGAMVEIRVKFQRWHDNAAFYGYLEDVVHHLCRLGTSKFQAPVLAVTRASPQPTVPGYISMGRLFSIPAPQLAQEYHSQEILVNRATRPNRSQPLRLQSLIETLETSARTSEYEKRYVADLRTSLTALLAQDHEFASHTNVTPYDLTRHLDSCKSHVAKLYSVLEAGAYSSALASNIHSVQQWPRISPILFLQQLSYPRCQNLPAGWKERIVEYGIALTALQRAQRLLKLSSSDSKDDFVNELRNTGHTNWVPYDHSDSLLMEVDSGIMIREVQERIAKQMREPEGCRNAVMQLNMGEGKSSVIVPAIGATLANGHRLVRVIVAKPQSKQMAQMLISKLGGLVNRRIYYLPLSRSLKLDETAAKVVHSMLQECMHNRGILLVQPEHILSFQLMAPECYICDKDKVAIGRQLMKTQDFMNQHARDIVDESDVNFSVRFELIYTMGMQSSIELSPDRWFFMQQILGLVKRLAPDLAERYPGSLEIHPSPHAGGFPRVRILHTDVGPKLVSAIASEITTNGLDGLQICRQSETVRNAIFEYLNTFDLDDAKISAVQDGPFWGESTKPRLLLLRGILACGVLVFALSQKRWRVNYGLASRTPSTRLAVPYHAKDNPSPRSEFSHPDVVIVLTSLCYYYQGLGDEDLFIALAHLVDSDQADVEYQVWVKDASDLPNAFRQLQGVNLKDRLQCVSELFPALRHGKSTVDYFLSHIVFPKEMKEFPRKLSASGWDIGKRKTQLTTGFSGTNDSRCLLPLDVEHLDLPEQKHTNALVLEYILRDENSVKLIEVAERGLTEAEFLLSTVDQLEPPVQVILDVGAQILELTNLEMAMNWLEMSDPSKLAAVFVDDGHELCVVDRAGRIDPLQISSYATRLDSCLVFLDESHTRGIDLKLPTHYRAAVTLGAGLTKDRLVQACMRMRKLGIGQTVVFCIPIEIQAKIRATKADHASEIVVADVLLWSITEQHAEMRRSMPLWAVQGHRFNHQQMLWDEVMHAGETTLNKTHAERFLEEEAQSIEHRYRPCPPQNQLNYLSNLTSVTSQAILSRCRDFDGLQFSSSTLQEEQERELSPEIEQERQIQKAPPARPAPHQLHPDVKRFALFGAFDRSSTAYMPAFRSLCGLSCGNDLELSQLAGTGNLLVSADFATTVKVFGKASMCDAFQRHVSSLLARRSPDRTVDVIMIISQYEANLLYPDMKSSPNALHQYKPRANLGYTALDEFDFHAISATATSPPVPRALAIQLNLFAGQLYISSYADYLEICRFMGLSTQHVTEEQETQGWQVDAEGFILCDGQGRVGGDSGLTRSPVNFFKVFMSKVRRNGDGIAKTHMGSLLEGRFFRELDWES